ncbi:MAG: hypothetical protein ABJC33_00690 [Betaproteobacteria bacterium]
MTRNGAGAPADARSAGGSDGWKLAGLAFVSLWFLLGGIAHFVATDSEMRVVPPYIPWPHAAVLVSGAFELLGAIGVLWRPTRRAAGMGLFALTIAVTPVHVYMLQRPELFDVPYWALLLRLPVQAALLALIAWSAVRGTPPSVQCTALWRATSMSRYFHGSRKKGSGL